MILILNAGVRHRTLARRRDRGCKQRGGFAGTRLQAPKGPKLGGSRSDARWGRSPKPAWRRWLSPPGPRTSEQAL